MVYTSIRVFLMVNFYPAREFLEFDCDLMLLYLELLSIQNTDHGRPRRAFTYIEFDYILYHNFLNFNLEVIYFWDNFLDCLVT